MSSVFRCLLVFLDGLATFRTFLKLEYSDENIEFWLKCEDYKKLTSSHKMMARAKKIFEQFVKADSPKEVQNTMPQHLPFIKYLPFISNLSFTLQINIDYRTREEIKRSVRKATVQCFDEAQKIVYGLMERDSYPRFLRSEMYKSLLESLAEDAERG